MTKTRNPRRIALDVLRNIKKNATTMVATWDQGQAKWDGSGWSKLLDSEKHENNPEQWERLAQFAAQIERDAAMIRQFAVEQAQTIRAVRQ